MCEKCLGSTWVLNENGDAVECECRHRYIYEVSLKRSKIGKDFANKTFNSFKADGNLVKIKEYAKRYADEYKGASIILMGQVGSGKTHLANAISMKLIEDGHEVIISRYRDMVTRLKQVVLDRGLYEREMDELKDAEILFIDDMFKGNVTDADINYVFDLIDHRYQNGKAVIVTTEKMPRDMIAIDEAITSRIFEMANGNVINLAGVPNYRMRGYL